MVWLIRFRLVVLQLSRSSSVLPLSAQGQPAAHTGPSLIYQPTSSDVLTPSVITPPPLCTLVVIIIIIIRLSNLLLRPILNVRLRTLPAVPGSGGQSPSVTVEVRVQAQASPFHICGGQDDTEKASFPCQRHSVLIQLSLMLTYQCVRKNIK